MKNYKVKDVIFGLRGEYVKAYEKVNALKENLSFYDSDKYDLYLSKINDNSKPTIMYSIKMDDKMPKSDRFRTVGGTFYDSETKKMHGERVFGIKNKGELIDKIDEIFDMEFTKEMGMCDPDDLKANKGRINNLVIWDNLIEFIRNDKRRRIADSVQYTAWNDKIHAETFKLFKKSGETFLAELLNEEVPEYALKLYHKELIEKHKLNDIVISNFPSDTKCDTFEIKENNNILVLRR